MNYVLGILIAISWLKFADSALNYSNFIVWGPGLESGFNLPVRYFYIQAVDDKFNK
jgi:hypothetical protein